MLPRSGGPHAHQLKPSMLLSALQTRIPAVWVLAVALFFLSVQWSGLAGSGNDGAGGGAIGPAGNSIRKDAMAGGECPERPACEACRACPTCPQQQPCPPCKHTCGVETLSLSSGEAVQLTSVAQFRPALTSGGHVHPVALTSGNKAMNRIIKNWATAIRRVRPPLPFVVAALDAAGYADLQATGYVNLYKDPAAHGVFQPGGSNYGDPKYADMSAYKWLLAADLLDTGVPVLLADPDVMMLRNPVPYISTLPQCDIYMQIDVDWVSTGEEIRKKNGWFYVNMPNFFCGGFALLSPTNGTRTHMRYFLDTVRKMQKDDPKIEEQSVWNRMMRDDFDRVGPNAVDAIMSKQCFNFVHKTTKQEVSVWPLNPNLFPNHPIAIKEKMPERILEPPFIVHYNWLYGIAAKEQEMRGAGHWFTNP